MMNLFRISRLASKLATPCITGLLAFGASLSVVEANHGKDNSYFSRIATFPVFQNTDIDEETVAEIVTATKDGMTLVYTDGAQEGIGFVDISDPYNPLPDGFVQLEGEPTSVIVVNKDRFAVVCVNTSASFVDASGHLAVVDMETREVVHKIELGGQPDAIAANPNTRWLGVCVENERDEDLGDGAPGQLPAGFVVIVETRGGRPQSWDLRKVDLTGLAEIAPEDPEPEFIDINRFNFAVVTLQENNHIVIINLRTGKVARHYSAGTVDLHDVDTDENGVIELKDSLLGVPREPDAVSWLNDEEVGTADEGDYLGGSRGFTIFQDFGKVRFNSGSNLDHLTAMIGHYPEERSENKGNEPEAIEWAKFRPNESLIFVGSERSSVVSVYKYNRWWDPEFIQVLPAGLGPEGIVALPRRQLLVVASEVDGRGDKFRSSITLYKRNASYPEYPTIASEDGPSGTPIPWGALSALAANPNDETGVHTVYDSFYKKSRIFDVDASGFPALITGETVIVDTDGVFMDTLIDAGYSDDSIMDLINDDMSVNLDPEGLSTCEDGGFWLASEGSGTVGSESRPFEFHNWIFKISAAGVIEEVVSLPEATNALQVRFGFEGVSAVGSGVDERVYVCIQRAWTGDPSDKARIGCYNPTTGEWTFAYYPLSAAESPNGGWVGLSEIVHYGGSEYLILERDNQGGPDARIKKVYKVDLSSVAFVAEGGAFETLGKSLARDLMPDLEAPNGAVIEKVEGLAILGSGDAVIVTDNDGVDDSNGETQFINLGSLSE